MSAQRAVGLVVRAFAVQVQFEVGKQGREAIGIFDLFGFSRPAFIPQAILLNVAFERPDIETMRVLLLHGHGCAVEHHACCFGLRQECPDLPTALCLAAACRVRPENPERVSVVTTNNRIDFFMGHDDPLL